MKTWADLRRDRRNSCRPRIRLPRASLVRGMAPYSLHRCRIGRKLYQLIVDPPLASALTPGRRRSSTRNGCGDCPDGRFLARTMVKSLFRVIDHVGYVETKAMSGRSLQCQPTQSAEGAGKRAKRVTADDGRGLSPCSIKSTRSWILFANFFQRSPPTPVWILP